MKLPYTITHTGNVTRIETSLSGYNVLYQPMLNKGSAFSKEERKTFALDGILPPHVSNIEEQCKRHYQSLSRKKTSLDKYRSLISLQHRNETLFYRFLYENLEEFMPIVYTPTVGQACEEFSQIFRRTKSLWITPDDRGKIKERLQNAPCVDVKLIVVTDNESILGIGDQGAGGIAISIGKLALYCIGAGIHPSHLLPISLDVGTNNDRLLRDPFYVGYRKPRLTGTAYDELVDEFVEAVQDLHPKALIQWEDFRKQNAYNILDRHKDTSLSFNDDIQGTASVALAGILTACRIKEEKLEDQRILILGAGAAGIGMGRLIKQTMEMLTPGHDILDHIGITDSSGLLIKDTDRNDPYKKDFRWSNQHLKKHDITNTKDILHIIKQFNPTVLIGASGQPGLFTKEMIEALSAKQKKPVIMPFSNPNSLSEAVPKDLMKWSDGNILVATGSPFPSFNFNNKEYKISQGNNVFIFPGVGLGALVSNAKTVTSRMFYVASQTLADQMTADELANRQLFPHVSRLREITKAIAVAIVCDSDPKISKEGATTLVESQMWYPDYPTLTRK